MPLCPKCNHWSEDVLVGDMCYNCLKFLGVNVDKMAHFFTASASSSAPSTSANNLPSALTPHLAQYSHRKITTAPSQYISQPGQNSLNVLKPPTTSRSALHSKPPLTVHDPPVDSGSMAHFRRIVKEKWVKPSNYGGSSKRAKPSTTIPTPPTASSIKHRDFGFLLYESDMLVKNTGIHQIKQAYNLDNPNLYNDLCTTLWAIFSPQILTKTHITSLPTNPEDFLCLSDGESRIPDQDTLLGVLKEAKGRKVAHINLTYDHPFTGDDSNSDPNSASPKRYPTRASTAAAISTQRTMACNHDKRKKKAEPWALGPLAGTVIARGNKILARKIALLSKPLPAYLNINRDGWVIAQRLIFDGIETTDTHTKPIVIKVNQEEVIGTGGMRTTYAAQVKTNTDGVETITDYVAKVMKNKDHQDLNLHATDARMYEACALLLEEYRSVVQACRGLPMSTKTKAKQMQIIRHSVVFTGDKYCPADIYFFEKRLTGTYVKYSSNIDFNVPVNQPGMDPKLLQLMDAFTHWTYNTSKGKNLVADLQGVGPLITDPQILDLDENLWTLGNNSTDGIQAFTEAHICNEVCRAIGLPEVGELAWENNQTRNQQRSPNEQSQSSSHANRPTRAPHASSSLSHLLISSDDEGVLPDPNTLFGTRSSFKSPRNTSN
ncbi:hypothetical protein PTTG_26847 [Puccinia triticina 1-1 BBBD Race 1]|uniref:Alpha-type protein kinase domain-containing protein n=1 Tax=Puccinia triticina (isolate 1-1 / race 1 (BBBD)) TaxID=630390 RepID=A0A180GPV1_PUCT1|nr:hypothetical protein PTTG_26847 [Puccinia triticina 1-1 BBBD Race 1]